MTTAHLSAHLPDPYDPAAFRDGLVAHGFLIPTGVRGGDGRSAKFEDVLDRFDALVMRDAAGDGAEALHFPPIVARTLIERMGYLGNFPQLVGSLHSFFGDDAAARELAALADAGQRWEHLLEPTETMLLPAACYPVYPVFSGLLPEGGRLVTVRNWCYRHEPSDEPTRLQSFRMREFIRAGAPETVHEWRDGWLQRGLALLQGLGLPAHSDVANDPFFGRVGQIIAVSQRQQALKFELLIPFQKTSSPTACMSFNYHREHFGNVWGIRDPSGEPAHTGCVAFGVDRLAVALFSNHGLNTAEWPAAVRKALGL